MPACDIVRTHKVSDSFRVSQVRGMFDYQKGEIEHRWSVNIPTEERDWKIGLIYGPSGSGKTTIANELFPNMLVHSGFRWPKDKPVIDGFGKELSTKRIVSTLNSVGFSSPPSWLKPFAILSNGQKFRVELAKALLENRNGLVFDEFTSVVDRQVAQIGCAAIEKTIRKKELPPFIAVSCHHDIIDWLRPDWVYDVGANHFEWRERRRRPAIKLDVHRADRSYWRMFREHHYLDSGINPAAQCYVATVESRPVAFSSVLHFPHASTDKFKREHRTVVLPDFQGVGIGNAVSEFVAKHYTEAGYRFISTTSAPAMIHHRNNSPNWKTTRFGRAPSVGKTSTSRQSRDVSAARFTASFEYKPKQK